MSNRPKVSPFAEMLSDKALRSMSRLPEFPGRIPPTTAEKVDLAARQYSRVLQLGLMQSVGEMELARTLDAIPLDDLGLGQVIQVGQVVVFRSLEGVVNCCGVGEPFDSAEVAGPDHPEQNAKPPVDPHERSR